MILTFLFAASFIVILTIYAGASLFLTEKLKDIVEPKTLYMKYIIAFCASGILSYGSKLFGSAMIFALLAQYGYVGEIPQIPGEALTTWWYFIVLHVGSFLVAGGIYDWRNKVK